MLSSSVSSSTVARGSGVGSTAGSWLCGMSTGLPKRFSYIAYRARPFSLTPLASLTIWAGSLATFRSSLGLGITDAVDGRNVLPDGAGLARRGLAQVGDGGAGHGAEAIPAIIAFVVPLIGLEAADLRVAALASSMQYLR